MGQIAHIPSTHSHVKSVLLTLSNIVSLIHHQGESYSRHSHVKSALHSLSNIISLKHYQGESHSIHSHVKSALHSLSNIVSLKHHLGERNSTHCHVKSVLLSLSNFVIHHQTNYQEFSNITLAILRQLYGCECVPAISWQRCDLAQRHAGACSKPALLSHAEMKFSDREFNHIKIFRSSSQR